MAREYLPAIDRIEIVHATGHRHTALYLGAWMTRQLGANLISKEDGAFRYECPERGELILSLVETKDQGRPGTVPAIVLEGGGARFEVVTLPGSPLLEIRSRFGVHETSAFLPGPIEGDEDLVNEILVRGGSNTLFAQVIPRITAML